MAGAGMRVIKLRRLYYKGVRRTFGPHSSLPPGRVFCKLAARCDNPDLFVERASRLVVLLVDRSRRS
jgi:hypothetical protein